MRYNVSREIDSQYIRNLLIEALTNRQHFFFQGWLPEEIRIRDDDVIWSFLRKSWGYILGIALHQQLWWCHCWDISWLPSSPPFKKKEEVYFYKMHNKKKERSKRLFLEMWINGGLFVNFFKKKKRLAPWKVNIWQQFQEPSTISLWQHCKLNLKK